MSRLLKPTEYAVENNISRQAVYAKIKKGLLTSKKIDGRIFVVLDEKDKSTPASTSLAIAPSQQNEMEALLQSKDETIAILKESIQNLKQTNNEINTTLRGEIELLKQVFTEMRSLYIKQVEHTSSNKKMLPTNTNPNQTECWIDIESFLEREKITKPKRKKKITKRVQKAFQQNDNRIKIEDNRLFLSCYDFYEDILR
jgi:hypothetical protein